MRVDVRHVPAHFRLAAGHPLLMYGLLRHEHKLTVVNLKLRRLAHTAYPLAIKSKETLVYHVGARRFTADAIFSQHTTGDKHKFERFMPEDSTFVASLIAPITFSNASVLVFKRMSNGNSPSRQPIRQY